MKTSANLDPEQTREAVRSHYGSIMAACREYDVSPQIFYAVLRNARGFGPTATVSRRIRERLETEGLVVYSEPTNIRQAK